MTNREAIRVTLAVVCTLAILGRSAAAEQSPKALRAERQITQAVERSLPFLEKEGTAWMKQRKCIACHHVPYLLWAHNEAAARGFAIDRTKLRSWNDWSLAFYPEESSWFKLGEKELRLL